ncbi:aromatic ring-hydroxylating dioxygenase subunit alpha [Sorangium sp. So ce315]|uniref:Rieske 2Fe-2S domain-containing protein n=1 Tax=Sorangium sp. So ce315 TaxID=3133299 RepID=UPI003F619444
MFEDFANVWTPVALAADLRADRPLAVRVAGTPLVLLRDREGKPSALLDRCPHRGVALSLGRVKDGCLECPFHGWQIEGSGQVCHVPWNPDAKLSTLRGVAFPARELAGQIWVYTAPIDRPATEPEAPPALLSPGVRISGFQIEWATHWTRAMENMLDWPHLPFVHRKTIGKSMAGRSDARMDIAWEERPWGAHTHVRIDGKPEAGSLDFRWPNQMNLHIPIPNKRMMMLVACVPIDGQRTRMLMTMARDFLTSPLFDFFFHRMNARIASEDRAIIESSFPVEIPPAGEERSVRTDAPTLLFRKRYFAELKGTSSGTDGEPSGHRALPMAREPLPVAGGCTAR